ncbi:mitochondrial transcription rescue factor 1 [Sorex araneus]|uniref:mitochondrial transcription rescue factor 1 n=1 Tax=Sorex araneus TaxID=42254 RepID=UPI002433A1D8|nr:mitochondrial transcription rescue factor 1 [Sorex araneus]XP_054993132.1 mitochondrial transcription rescue factor 1 [Sorex araneus]
MAVPSVRLPASLLRKPDAWLRLWATLRGTPCAHTPHTSWKRYFYFSSTKSTASNHKTFLQNIFSLRLPGLFVSPQSIFPLSLRLKSSVSSKKSAKKTQQKVEEEEDSDEEVDRELSVPGEELEDDPSMPRDYKDLEKTVQSFRYDVILKTGLDVGRNKVEDAFYKGDLRLNGEKLWKKSRTVKVGDALDLVLEENKDAETETVMRILLKKVFEEKTQSDKFRVVLRRWKRLQLQKKNAAK